MDILPYLCQSIKYSCVERKTGRQQWSGCGTGQEFLQVARSRLAPAPGVKVWHEILPRLIPSPLWQPASWARPELLWSISHFTRRRTMILDHADHDHDHLLIMMVKGWKRPVQIGWVGWRGEPGALLLLHSAENSGTETPDRAQKINIFGQIYIYSYILHISEYWHNDVDRTK